MSGSGSRRGSIWRTRQNAKKQARITKGEKKIGRRGLFSKGGSEKEAMNSKDDPPEIRPRKGAEGNGERKGKVDVWAGPLKRE